MFRKILATSTSWAPLPIRLGCAAIFIAHGSQKVLGSFGGSGFKAFIEGETPFSFMRPTWLWLGAAALSELVGGILVGIGFLTRVGAFFLLCTMATAISIHWPNFFASNRGYEYALALATFALSLLISGGGILSVDRAITGGRVTGGRR